jgi:hypothetical protein
LDIRQSSSQSGMDEHAPHFDRSDQPSLPQHCLNFLPDPQGQGAFLPVVAMA